MPLNFHPAPGLILICDFTTGFQPPEMVKKRPVVVISPRRRNGQLVTVVPLSSVEPIPSEPWHHKLVDGTYPLARSPMWAKCDMVQTVGTFRLDRVMTKDINGKRAYMTYQMNAVELAAVLTCVKAALGLA